MKYLFYLLLFSSQGSHKALCPFHLERTPSFTVDPERQSYFYYGCGEKGDVFELFMKFEGISFPEAVKKLKDELNMSEEELKKITPRKSYKSKRTKLPDKDIEVLGYRSFPHEKPWSPFSAMDRRDYKGYPGAIQFNEGRGPYWLLNVMGKEILIPFRNEKNLIVGWQIRLDDTKHELYIRSDFEEFQVSENKSEGTIRVMWERAILSDIHLEVGQNKTFQTKIKGEAVILGEVGLKKGQIESLLEFMNLYLDLTHILVVQR